MNSNNRILNINFADLYPAYLNKITQKGRSEEELLEILSWLTGYNSSQLQRLTVSLEEFFNQAPALNPNRRLIIGSICGVKIQDIVDPIIKDIRIMDKLVDDLAKGKNLDAILTKYMK